MISSRIARYAAWLAIVYFISKLIVNHYAGKGKGESDGNLPGGRGNLDGLLGSLRILCAISIPLSIAIMIVISNSNYSGVFDGLTQLIDTNSSGAPNLLPSDGDPVSDAKLFFLSLAVEILILIPFLTLAAYRKKLESLPPESRASERSRHSAAKILMIASFVFSMAMFLNNGSGLQYLILGKLLMLNRTSFPWVLYFLEFCAVIYLLIRLRVAYRDNPKVNYGIYIAIGALAVINLKTILLSSLFAFGVLFSPFTGGNGIAEKLGFISDTPEMQKWHDAKANIREDSRPRRSQTPDYSGDIFARQNAKQSRDNIKMPKLDDALNSVAEAGTFFVALFLLLVSLIRSLFYWILSDVMKMVSNIERNFRGFALDTAAPETFHHIMLKNFKYLSYTGIILLFGAIMFAIIKSDLVIAYLGQSLGMLLKLPFVYNYVQKINYILMATLPLAIILKAVKWTVIVAIAAGFLEFLFDWENQTRVAGDKRPLKFTALKHLIGSVKFSGGCISITFLGTALILALIAGSVAKKIDQGISGEVFIAQLIFIAGAIAASLVIYFITTFFSEVLNRLVHIERNLREEKEDVSPKFIGAYVTEKILRAFSIGGTVLIGLATLALTFAAGSQTGGNGIGIIFLVVGSICAIEFYLITAVTPDFLSCILKIESHVRQKVAGPDAAESIPDSSH